MSPSQPCPICVSHSSDFFIACICLHSSCVLSGSQDTIARATESETDAETLMQRQSTRTEEQIKTKEGEAARQLRVMAQAAEEKLATKQAEVDRRLQVLGEETQVRAQIVV